MSLARSFCAPTHGSTTRLRNFITRVRVNAPIEGVKTLDAEETQTAGAYAALGKVVLPLCFRQFGSPHNVCADAQLRRCAKSLSIPALQACVPVITRGPACSKSCTSEI